MLPLHPKVKKREKMKVVFVVQGEGRVSPSVSYVCIGHQYLFLHEGFNFPCGKYFSRLGLIFFTRLTCMRASKKLALSFRKMPDDLTHNIKVVLPLLRSEVKRLKASNGNYIHGYMVNSGFGDNIFDWHKLFLFVWLKNINTQEIFSDLCFICK